MDFCFSPQGINKNEISVNKLFRSWILYELRKNEKQERRCDRVILERKRNEVNKEKKNGCLLTL